MTFLLDHCVWRETEDILRHAGFKCRSLRGLGRSEAANGEVIALAKAHKAILITRDRDFANTTIYPLGSHPGIILLRITSKTMLDVHRVLLKALQLIPAEHLAGSLLIIDSASYRLRQP